MYIGQWHVSPLQSRDLRTQHSSPRVSSTLQNTLQNPLLELPSAVPLYFPESHRQTENSSLSKVLLVLWKARSHRVPNLGCGGAESPGWFGVSQKISWDMMHERVHCLMKLPVINQLPIAAASWIVSNSFHRGMFNLNTEFDADSLLFLFSHF